MSKQQTNGTSHSGSFKAYLSGFILSIVLTLAAFYMVQQSVLEGWALLLVITALAIGQLLVQVLFFLHLGREEKPRWNLIAFMFMSLVVVIVVLGSLWIMHSLNYNMQLPQDDSSIMDKENIYRPGYENVE